MPSQLDFVRILFVFYCMVHKKSHTYNPIVGGAVSHISCGEMEMGGLQNSWCSVSFRIRAPYSMITAPSSGTYWELIADASQQLNQLTQ